MAGRRAAVPFLIDRRRDELAHEALAHEAVGDQRTTQSEGTALMSRHMGKAYRWFQSPSLRHALINWSAVMRWSASPIVVALLVLAGCGKEPSVTQLPAEAILRVLVTKTGEVRAEGRTVTIDELGKMFAELARRNGSVFYFRENPTAPEPHPNAMKVMDLIVEHRLPVRMATGPDFQDSVNLSDRVPRKGD